MIRTYLSGVFAACAVRDTVDPQSPIRSFLPLANEIAERLAAKTRGLPQSTIPEMVLGLPTTSTCRGIRGSSTRFETRRGVLTAAPLSRGCLQPPTNA